MIPIRWILAGLLFTSMAFGQGQIRIDNTYPGAPLVYSNDCNLHIGPIQGPYKLYFYAGQTRENLSVVGAWTNNILPQLAGRLTPVTFTLPAGFPAGQLMWFQLRGEEILPLGQIGLTGESPIGYVIPSIGPFPIPNIFGTGPGQIGSFEIRGLCPNLTTQRLGPDGPFRINRIHPGITIGWTNSWQLDVPAFRVQAAEFILGPWTVLGDTLRTNDQMFFALPASASAARFYTVEWTNAPPAQPASPWLGNWYYQALDKSDAIIAAGILSFTSNVPLLGYYRFMRLNNSPLHPAGTNAFTFATLSRSNLIEVIFPDRLSIRGQMIHNRCAGDWSVSGSQHLHGGRFIMLRKD